MKHLLVGPDREENLSLRYLSAALLKAGHEVELARFDGPDDFDSVAARATDFEVVGLSMCFQSRAREFLELGARIKHAAPGTFVVAGGHYATCAADDLLEHHPELDLVVLHEGERTLVELADARFDASRLPLIAGIAFRARGQVLRTPPRPIEKDLDSLPFPDRRGRVRTLAGVKTAYLFGSRGCFSNCDYCCIMALHRTAPGPRFRQRSVDNVVREMAELYHGRKVRQFVFHDDNFLVPSVRRNHKRLDALRSAWAEQGLTDLGLVLKCRPGDLDPSVLEKLKQMGLLRLFLGIESASQAGLCSIGRQQRVEESERALALCRKVGISAQYTLMMFHPDATVDTLRADLDFFQRHDRHPLNFCRVETYAGTAIEARLRAQGRGRGNYLARTYRIADPVVDDVWRLAARLLGERCWATDSLMETAIGLDHLAAVGRHFCSSPAVARACEGIDDWLLRVNRDLLALLGDLLDTRLETTGLEDPELHRRARLLVAHERAARPTLMAEGHKLRARLTAACQRHLALRSGGSKPLAHTAAAAALAAALATCCGVNEYAANPIEDPDGDGLPSQCELDIFGTDPNQADSDGDGIADGDENHDFGTLTNAEEQAQAGAETCADIEDDVPVSEYAPEPLVDTDGDGLPDQCETQVFKTDPNLIDTDNDGTDDGDEDHDGLGMTNLEEQAVAGKYDCVDVEDRGITEMAAAPLTESGGADVEPWVTAILEEKQAGQ